MIRGIAALLAIAAIGGWVSFFKLRANMQTWVAATYRAIDVAEKCLDESEKFRTKIGAVMDRIDKATQDAAK